MTAPDLNLDEFPPICTQPVRVDSPGLTSQKLQNTPPIQADPIPVAPTSTEAPPQVLKSFVDVVNSQATDSSFPTSLQHSYLAGALPAQMGVKTEECSETVETPATKRQSSGCAKAEWERGSNAENVIFERGEPSNGITENQRRKNVTVAVGIESINMFDALNQMEGEDARGGATQPTQPHIVLAEANDQTAEELQAANHRYQTEPLNHVMQILTENDGSPTPQTHVEINTPMVKCNTCNVDVNVDHNCGVIIDQNCDVAEDHNCDVIADQNCNSTVACDVMVDKKCDGTVDHNCDVAVVKLLCEGETSVVGHCEGVAKEAPLQCVALGLFSPNPFNILIAEGNHINPIVDCRNTTECSYVTQIQVQPCTLNQAAIEFCTVPENESDMDVVSLREQEDDTSQQHSDSSGEWNSAQSASSQSSMEDATVRGRHKRTQSIPSSSQIRILTRSKAKNGGNPSSTQI
ncbi:hypothetical protein Salat_1592300 [Sesamum alatum]|uniref:Uncharacterized protein n=1 Tax=Sesamum alatum TaxID=300844 RepID=A0AAE1Y624_9LAMI|nr:hypothetical protein Salat_1592300 [Sesamum alatum]